VATGAEHPSVFNDDGFRMIEVGVRPQSDDGIEGLICKRQVGRLCLYKFGRGIADALACNAPLVARNVQTDRCPAKLAQPRDRNARPASEAERFSRPRANR
jgi:hypothetical protein